MEPLYSPIMFAERFIAGIKCYFKAICPLMLIHAEEKKALVNQIYLITFCSCENNRKSILSRNSHPFSFLNFNWEWPLGDLQIIAT